MTAKAAVVTTVSIALLPGRSIAFSPEWRDDGLSVLFDRNSGDYWVVSALARKIVENVALDGDRKGEELARLALCALSREEKAGVMPTMVQRIIDELVQMEILVRVGARPCGSATSGGAA